MALVVFLGPPGSGSQGGSCGGSGLNRSDEAAPVGRPGFFSARTPVFGGSALLPSISRLGKTPDWHPPGSGMSALAKRSVKNYVSPSRTPFISS